MFTTPQVVSTGELATADIQNTQIVASIIALYAGEMSVTSQAVGDLLYASSTTQWARIADVATGQVLVSRGVGVAPAWSANPAISGTLAVTGVATFTALPVFTTPLTTLGTIATGVWNAGAVTSSGLLTVSGTGTHAFSGSVDGKNAIELTNTNTGTAAFAMFQAEAGSITAYFRVFSQNYTTSGLSIASSSLLSTLGSAGLSIAANHASGAIRFYSGGTTLRAQINTNGTQTWAPYGAGTATFDASGNITSVSDERWKDRIAPLPYGLAEVLQLRPVQHGYNALSGLERDHLYGGFLAQDVQRIMPLAVGQNPDGYLTLADRPILGAMVHAIQELNQRLAHLEANRH